MIHDCLKKIFILWCSYRVIHLTNNNLSIQLPFFGKFVIHVISRTSHSAPSDTARPLTLPATWPLTLPVLWSERSAVRCRSLTWHPPGARIFMSLASTRRFSGWVILTFAGINWRRVLTLVCIRLPIQHPRSLLQFTFLTVPIFCSKRFD